MTLRGKLESADKAAIRVSVFIAIAQVAKYFQRLLAVATNLHRDSFADRQRVLGSKLDTAEADIDNHSAKRFVAFRAI